MTDAERIAKIDDYLAQHTVEPGSVLDCLLSRLTAAEADRDKLDDERLIEKGLVTLVKSERDQFRKERDWSRQERDVALQRVKLLERVAKVARSLAEHGISTPRHMVELEEALAGEASA